MLPELSQFTAVVLVDLRLPHGTCLVLRDPRALFILIKMASVNVLHEFTACIYQQGYDKTSHKVVSFMIQRLILRHKRKTEKRKTKWSECDFTPLVSMQLRRSFQRVHLATLSTHYNGRQAISLLLVLPPLNFSYVVDVTAAIVLW